MTGQKPTQGSAVLTWMPVAAMAVVAGADVVAGPGWGFCRWSRSGRLFSGLVGGWRRTALIGAVALLVCVALGMYDGLFEERRGFTAMASVAGVTGVGIAAAVTRSRRRRSWPVSARSRRWPSGYCCGRCHAPRARCRRRCRTPRRSPRRGSAVTCTRWWPRRTASG